MWLWIILSVISIIVAVIVYVVSKCEDLWKLFVSIGCCVSLMALVSIFCSGACSPNQYKPSEENMFSRTVCSDIVVTPHLNSDANASDLNTLNIEYRVSGNTATLSEKVKVYYTEFLVSETGYPYIERYVCEWLSPVRNFLYGVWGRPRWFYKIYLMPEE